MSSPKLMEEIINEARLIHHDGINVQVDEPASEEEAVEMVSETDDGWWVKGWVFVSKEEGV